LRDLRPNEGAIVFATGSMSRTAVAKPRKATSADAINLKRRLAKDAGLRRTLARLRSAANKPGTLASSLVVGGSVADIPGIAVAAYQAAAFKADISNPGCDIQWTLVAGIGRVESDHGSNGGSAIGANGVVRPAILGPVLSGTDGNAAIPDTDGGRYDGDKIWDRAVGPMQFIPSTWATWGRDGNGDGIADPENIFDAALSTADLNTAGGAENAVLSYNHSLDYVLVVLGYSSAYGGQDLTPVSAEIAAYLEALAKAAEKAPKHAAHKPVKKASKPVARPTTHPSPKPTVTPSPSTKPTVTPKPTPKPTTTPTSSPTPTPTPSPSATATPSASTSPDEMDTPEPTVTP
jgi:hypothetical protein